jgi:gamma-glutamylaminecyclotransferase
VAADTVRSGTFNLFTYGTLQRGHSAAGMLDGCEYLGPATVNGILYDIDGRYPAIVLYGSAAVHGEVWRCPSTMLEELDRYEGTESGLFRRVAIEARTEDGAVACWLYSAGPRLSRKLVPEARLEADRWVAG